MTARQRRKAKRMEQWFQCDRGWNPSDNSNLLTAASYEARDRVLAEIAARVHS